VTRTGLLTPSERTVLVLLANGLRPRDIAKEHGLVIGTIRTHVQNAKRTLGAHTTPQAVAAALILGEIRPDQILIRARRPT
jgi:DNA-binding CsgD family transcriptional regulator